MSVAKKAPKRSGILAGGNWIIDQVKMIDVYPQREQLANIHGAAVTGTGGSPYNLLVNLAKLGADVPLSAAGLVGKDAFGQLIQDDCKKFKIDTKFLTATADAPTSSGKHIRVPMPGRALPAEQVAEARGFADAFALRCPCALRAEAFLRLLPDPRASAVLCSKHLSRWPVAEGCRPEQAAPYHRRAARQPSEAG